MNDNSKSSIRRFSIEQKRMSDKLRNAEVGLKGAYNTLEDINRAYRHQENSKQRLMDQINKLKPMHQIATIHGMRTVGSPTADADKAIMLESMEHYLNLYNNDSLLKELEEKIDTSGRKLDGTISEKIKKEQALRFKNKAKARHQKSVSTGRRNMRRLESIKEGAGSNRRKTKRKKHKRKKHKRKNHKGKKRTKKRQKRRRKRRTKKHY